MLGSLGFSVGDMGGWGAALIWGVTAAIVFPVTIIYSELAAMFPNKSGGLAIYANEAWRKYTTLIGPVATFGYWIGWSVVLSFFGRFVGSIVQSQWFPGEPSGRNGSAGSSASPVTASFSTGSVTFGSKPLIPLGSTFSVGP